MEIIYFVKKLKGPCSQNETYINLKKHKKKMVGEEGFEPPTNGV